MTSVALEMHPLSQKALHCEDDILYTSRVMSHERALGLAIPVRSALPDWNAGNSGS